MAIISRTGAAAFYRWADMRTGALVTPFDRVKNDIPHRGPRQMRVTPAAWKRAAFSLRRGFSGQPRGSSLAIKPLDRNTASEVRRSVCLVRAGRGFCASPWFLSGLSDAVNDTRKACSEPKRGARPDHSAFEILQSSILTPMRVYHRLLRQDAGLDGLAAYLPGLALRRKQRFRPRAP
jgi:hypothetical protein